MLDWLVACFAGLIMGVIFEDPIKQLWINTCRNSKRFYNRNKKNNDPRFFTIGKMKTQFYICDGNGIDYFTQDNIETIVDPTRVELPNDLKKLVIATENKQKLLQELNSPDYCWNGPLVTLNNHVINRTRHFEDLKVRFTFSMSDYYTFLALNKNLDYFLTETDTIRSKYLNINQLDTWI